MIIMGIDPGSKSTGFGLIGVEGNRLQLIDFGAVKTKTTDTLPLRLKTIYDGISSIIIAHNPDFIAIENVFYSDNVKTALVIGHARGVAMLAGMNRQIPVAEYSPREVKQSVVGNGAPAKEQVGFMVKKILGLNGIPRPVDAADALGIAICHFNRTKTEQKLGQL
jgi:crossover junction endodeoxyribonuclease RuvC